MRWCGRIGAVLIAVFTGGEGSLFATSLGLLGGVASKRRPHVQLRERPSQVEPERWFMPGALGHELGEAPPLVSGKAYLSRVMVGGEAADGEEWARRNGLTEAVPFSHNLSSLFPISLFENHPDYFPQRDGARWKPAETGLINWNPDLGNPAVAERVATEAKNYFGQNPDAVSFAVGINDGLVFGDSPDTLKWTEPLRWFRGRPDFSDLIYQFSNRVGRGVGESSPDKYVGALAYYWGENTPRFDVEPNVLPFLTADRAQGYSKAFRQEERALQRAWARKGTGRLGLYDYSYGQGFLIPRQHTRLLAENVKAARRLGFTDYFAEQFPNWGLDGAQPWLVAQLLQHPDASPRVLLNEYYRRYFKEAAAPMRRFFERCEQQWMNQKGEPYWLKHWRNPSQASLFPSEVCRELRALLEEAKRKASSDVVKARVEFVSDSFAVTESLVAMVEARDALKRAVFSHESVGLDQLEQARETRRVFAETLQRLQQVHPIALHGEDGRVFLADDPTYPALRVLADRGVAVGGQGKAWADAARVAVAMADTPIEDITDIEHDGSFEGALKPERKIGGLVYEAAMPPGWTLKIEPTQKERSQLTAGAARSGARGLRMEGATLTRAFQWRPVEEGAILEATVWARGLVGISSRVQMSVNWLDENQAPLPDYRMIQLPEGSWPQWVALRQGMVIPAGAKWVGITLIAMNQSSADWVEWDDVCLRTILPPQTAR